MRTTQAFLRALPLARRRRLCSKARVRYAFQYRRYRLPFRTPVRTARGVWAEREGVCLRLTDEAGRVNFGESAPIPGFSQESADDVEETCRLLGGSLSPEQLEQVPASLPTLRHALETATSPIPETRQAYLAVAALLPAGRAAIALAQEKAESGFRVFKWKVGVGDVADELSLLDDLCAVLPDGSRLRLDANGAWDRRRAERWLERCAERPIEFLEQPVLAAPADGESGRRRADDLLLGLAGAYPTPIALDESLAADGDVERWLGAGWPGIFVVKPALHAAIGDTLARLAKAKAEVVFSSALETAIGARSALRIAFSWAGNATKDRPPRAIGFGVWPLFEGGVRNGPAAAPFLRREDVERIDVEAAWNALS